MAASTTIKAQDIKLYDCIDENANCWEVLDVQCGPETDFVVEAFAADGLETKKFHFSWDELVAVKVRRESEVQTVDAPQITEDGFSVRFTTGREGRLGDAFIGEVEEPYPNEREADEWFFVRKYIDTYVEDEEEIDIPKANQEIAEMWTELVRPWVDADGNVRDY